MTRCTLVILAPIAAAVMCTTSTTAAGQSLVCAQDESSFRVMCFAKTGVRANGEVRAAKLWMGGPKNIPETNFTARAHCRTRVLELTDRDGVAFQRDVPATQLGKDFVTFLCAHTPAKNDPKLSTK